MGIRYWNKREERQEEAAALAAATGLPALACRVLAARGRGTPALAQELTGEDDRLFDPLLLKDMDRAVARVSRAIEEGERIVVYGDYDCDGVTSTALLYHYLEAVGADVLHYIPDREVEGYGLNKQAIHFLHSVRQAELIITVDNGISAHEEIDYAASLGVDVVVTDHHQPRETLPAAVAVVDPHRPDCPSPFKDLAGVGVAFKLVCALEGDDGDELMEHYADLVALGTIADVVPLLRDNRILVRRGLGLLADSERPGLQALQQVAGLWGKPLTAENAAFGLAPRINAAGRMGDVYHALELLLTEDPETARELAEQLDAYNRQRKEVESQILQDILTQLTADPSPLNQRVILLAGEGWHHGVVGILCSRLVERFGKPCFLLSMDGEEVRASGRGVEGLSVIEGVAACGEYLTRFGGHAQAAGFSLAKENLPAFTQAFLGWFDQHWPTMPRLAMTVDCSVRLGELTVANVAGLGRLEPIGSGNPAPVFSVEGAVLEGITPLSGGKHLRLQLRQGDATGEALWFGMTPQKLPYQVGDRLDLAVALEVNAYNGRESVSIKVRDVRPSGSDQEDLWRGRERYDALLRQEVSGEDYVPDREEMGRVYRCLRKNGGYDHGCDLFWQQLGGTPDYCKMMVAIDALAELGLVQVSGLGSERQILLLPAAGKVDLANSKVLRGHMGEVAGI